MTTAIILAAGVGSRLRPYTDDKPKGMVEVNGKPILQYQFDTLNSGGINDILVVTGYIKEKIVSQGGAINKIENPRWNETNMVASLYCAREWLKDDIVIGYADIIYQKSVLDKLMSNQNDIVVSADREFLRYWDLRLENPLDDVESFATDESGCISSIGQKCNALDEIEAQYIGLMRFKGEGLNKLNETLDELSKTDAFDNMYMTDLLMHMIDNKTCLTPSYHENCWLEIDSVDDLKVAESALNFETEVNLIEAIG